MDETLAKFLNKNQSQNIAIIGFFSNYPVESYYIEGNSSVILGRSDNLWMHISSSSVAELNSLLRKYNARTKFYFSVEDWMIPEILKYGTADWIMTTNRFILDDEVMIGKPKSEIVEIDKKYAGFIYNNSDYKAFLSIEYIEDRIEKDVSAGILIDDKLVAWGFTHDDGALGFLHVLKEHRKKGLGKEILSGLIQMKRMKAEPVFGNIVPDNVASMNLLRKIGFKLDCKTSWIKLK